MGCSIHLYKKDNKNATAERPLDSAVWKTYHPKERTDSSITSEGSHENSRQVLRLG